MIRNIIIAIAGLLCGVGVTIGGYFYVNRNTEIWTTTAELTGENGLIIPPGTEMVYDRSMSEGFHRTRIYLNLSIPTTEQKIEKSISEHSFLIPPVWAE